MTLILSEKFSSAPGFKPGSPVLRTGAIPTERRAADSGSNPGSGDNFLLKLTTKEQLDGYPDIKISFNTLTCL